MEPKKEWHSKWLAFHFDVKAFCKMDSKCSSFIHSNICPQSFCAVFCLEKARNFVDNNNALFDMKEKPHTQNCWWSLTALRCESKKTAVILHHTKTVEISQENSCRKWKQCKSWDSCLIAFQQMSMTNLLVSRWHM